MNPTVRNRVYLAYTVIGVISFLCCAYLTVLVIRQHHSPSPMLCSISESSGNCETNESMGWSSCGKCYGAGTCASQIKVDVRRRGSDVLLESCDSFETKYCDGDNPNQKSYHCINGDCANMEGLFNCSSWRITSTEEICTSKCMNITDVLVCNVTETESPIRCNTKKACMGLDGLYQCREGECSRISPPFNCKKQCNHVNTDNKNVIVIEGDKIYSGRCAKALKKSDLDSLHEFSRKSDYSITLVISCSQLLEHGVNDTSYNLIDCFKGALVESEMFGKSTNRDVLVHEIDMRMGQGLFRNQIVNNTRLYFQECLDNLECDEFLMSMNNLHNTFQCYYSPNHSNSVLLRLPSTNYIGLIFLIIALCVIATLLVRNRIIRFWSKSFGCCNKHTESIAMH